MPNPTLAHRFSGWQAFTDPSDVAQCLDDIADWLNSAVADDHGARVPADRWQAVKEVDGVTVAIRCYPPAASGAPNQRLIIAGTAAAAETPAMFGSDTFVADSLIAALVCEVTDEGDYQGFDDAAPYVGGVFSSYVRLGGVVTELSSWAVIESDETLTILLRVLANDNIYAVDAGALIDTFDAAAQHADGRRYAIATTGTVAINKTMFSSSGGNGVLYSSKNNTANIQRLLLRTMADAWGLRTAINMWQSRQTWNGSSTATSRQTLLNENETFACRIPVWIASVGPLRGRMFVPDEVCGALVGPGGSPEYIVVSNSASGQNDSYGFQI